jgi:hypothetical protein
MLIFHGYVTLAEANYFMDLTNERLWDSCNQQSPCEDGDPSTTGLGTNTHGFDVLSMTYPSSMAMENHHFQRT